MDKLELTGQNLGRVFNFSSGCVHALLLYFFETKLPNLKVAQTPSRLSPVSCRAPRLGSLTQNVLIQLNGGRRCLWNCVDEARVTQNFVDDGVSVGHPLTVGQAHLAPI
jgi:hypothetical protein